MMKRSVILLSALLFVTAAGCSSKEEESQDPIYTVILDDFILETEPETSQSTTEPVASETALLQSTAASETESTASGSETSSDVPVQSATVSDTAAPEGSGETSIIGTWKYVDGYFIRFLENNSAEYMLDYSSMISFSQDTLYYDGVRYSAVTDEEIVSVSDADGNRILKMTALEREDGSNYDGRYRLEDCSFYQYLISNTSAAAPEYYIEVSDSVLWVITKGSYQTTPDGTLQMVQNGSTLDLNYTLDESGLTITDVTGAQDVLMRVE